MMQMMAILKRTTSLDNIKYLVEVGLLNFQNATWHHLKHFQRKAEGDQPVISIGAASWPGWTNTHAGTLTFLSEDS